MRRRPTIEATTNFFAIPNKHQIQTTSDPDSLISQQPQIQTTSDPDNLRSNNNLEKARVLLLLLLGVIKDLQRGWQGESINKQGIQHWSLKKETINKKIPPSKEAINRKYHQQKKPSIENTTDKRSHSIFCDTFICFWLLSPPSLSHSLPYHTMPNSPAYSWL